MSALKRHVIGSSKMVAILIVVLFLILSNPTWESLMAGIDREMRDDGAAASGRVAEALFDANFKRVDLIVCSLLVAEMGPNQEEIMAFGVAGLVFGSRHMRHLGKTMESNARSYRERWRRWRASQGQ